MSRFYSDLISTIEKIRRRAQRHVEDSSIEEELNMDERYHQNAQLIL
jgi:hypothetical protein